MEPQPRKDGRLPRRDGGSRGVTVAGDSIKQITYREQGCGNRFAQLTFLLVLFQGDLQGTGCLKSSSLTQREQLAVVEYCWNASRRVVTTGMRFETWVERKKFR